MARVSRKPGQMRDQGKPDCARVWNAALYVRLSVEDNGCGMEQKKAEEIISYCSKGYGLKNVKERIGLIYQEECPITIESKEGIGAKVILRMKIHSEGNIYEASTT